MCSHCDTMVSSTQWGCTVKLWALGSTRFHVGTVRKIHKHQRFVSENDTEVSFNFISIKVKSYPGHTPRVFSLEVSEGAASFYPSSRLHGALFLSPARKVQPSRTACHKFPLEPGVLPQRSQVQPCADSSVSGAKPGRVRNPKSAETLTAINTHTFPHGTVCKDISTHLSDHF